MGQRRYVVRSTVIKGKRPGRLVVRRAAGFSAPHGEIPQAKPSSELRLRKRRLFVRPYSRGSVASFLLFIGNRAYVFRTFVLSIVLTLAVAPNAALLCTVWCHPQPATSSPSHHGECSAASSASYHGERSAASSALHDGATSATSSVMSGDETCPDCDKAGLGAVQFLREDVRRSVSALHAVHAILVPCYQFAFLTADTRPQHERWRECSLEERPLPTILRV